MGPSGLSQAGLPLCGTNDKEAHQPPSTGPRGEPPGRPGLGVSVTILEKTLYQDAKGGPEESRAS